MNVRFWGNEMELGGKYIDADLRDSNDILHNRLALEERLAEDGYLLVRGLRSRDSIAEARRQILERLELKAGVDTPATTGVRGNIEMLELAGVRALFRMPEVISFFELLLGGTVATFDFQWLRVAGRGAESPIHSDIVFMGRGTPNVYTCWTPLGDVPIEMGPIVMLPGSHRIEALRDTYWKADVDRDLIEGCFSRDPVEVADRFGGRWSTTHFREGDVLIFGMHVLHASLANMTDQVRISADARYQQASEPMDERWRGPEPKGHYNFWRPGVELEPLAVTRARWGL